MDSSQWPTLSTPDPEVEAALKANPLPSGDIADPAAIRPIIGETMKTTIYSRLDFSGVEQSTIDIPMRDGSVSKSLLFKPSSAPMAGGCPLAVLFHGGGWILGVPEMEGLSAVPLVKELGCVVVSVEYRLAPENPFPIPVNDCWDALHWCASNASSLSADPLRGFLIGGSSAGANIAAVLQHVALRENLSPPVTGAWLAYPSTVSMDHMPEAFKHEHTSRVQNADAPFLTTKAFETGIARYAPEPRSELFQALNWTSHAGVSRTYTHICGLDPVRDDGLLYDRELRKAGVESRVGVYPGCPHGVDVILPQVEQAKKFEKDRRQAFKWLLRKD